MNEGGTNRSLWDRANSTQRDFASTPRNDNKAATDKERSLFKRSSMMRRNLSSQRKASDMMANYIEHHHSEEFPTRLRERMDTIRVFPEENMEDFRKRASQRLGIANKPKLSFGEKLAKFVKLSPQAFSLNFLKKTYVLHSSLFIFNDESLVRSKVTALVTRKSFDAFIIGN
mgnify:CR=1 FL=1